MLRVALPLFTILLGPALIGSAQAQTPAAPAAQRVQCAHCKLDWNTSPTRIEALIKQSNGTKQTVQYASMPCMQEAVEAAGVSLLRFKILDYATFGSAIEAMLDGDQAWYVVDTEKPLVGSREPFIAAFVDQGHARSGVEALGGTVLNHGALTKRQDEERKAREEAGLPNIAPGTDYYVCPCTGGCCDHIQSDKPGECPDCGMALVKKSEKDKQEN